MILTGYTLKFLGGAVVSEPVEPTLAQGLQKSVLRLVRSCTLPKCFSTTSKYHGQPTSTIMSDWNNVYGIGESYHYDFIQLIPVESLVVVKMASNCQIVPLAPEKNSDSENHHGIFVLNNQIRPNSHVQWRHDGFLFWKVWRLDPFDIVFYASQHCGAAPNASFNWSI